jgi:DNA-binding transcriptional regulator YhcF (GntR family)
MSTRELLYQIIEKLNKEGEQVISVTRLAKEAALTRSTIYKYYPDVLSALGRGTSDQAAIESAIFAKNEILNRQLKKNLKLVAYLTNICTNQLVEISELRELYDQLERGNAAKINYLESKILKLTKVPLRPV